MYKSNMEQDILKVLYSEEELKKRVQEMGDELYEKYKDKNPLFLMVLKGSFIFMADLVRACQLKSDMANVSDFTVFPPEGQKPQGPVPRPHLN